MIQLRDYQEEFVNDILFSIAKNKKVLAILPTGGGKTVVLSEIVRRYNSIGRYVQIIVHRKEIKEQIENTCKRNSCTEGLYSVAMVQAKNAKPSELTIVDEAHHITAKTYRAWTEASQKVVGLTATPMRTDGKNFDEFFYDIVIGPQKSTLIAQGNLVPSKVFTTPAKWVETIKKDKTDFNVRSMIAEAKHARLEGDIVAHYAEHCADKQVIVYAVSVELAKLYAQTFANAGLSACAISGDMRLSEREQLINKYRKGEVKILVNCEIATEGVDVPETYGVMILRPTASLVLWLQMCGRASRPAPNKTECVVLDHAGCFYRHGHPDKDRQWTLTPFEEKKKKKPAPESPKIPFLQLAPEKIITAGMSFSQRKLIAAEITADNTVAEILSMAFTYPMQKNGKPNIMKAIRSYERTNRTRLSLDLLRKIAKYAGYHNKWAEYFYAKKYSRC